MSKPFIENLSVAAVRARRLIQALARFEYRDYDPVRFEQNAKARIRCDLPRQSFTSERRAQRAVRVAWPGHIWRDFQPVLNRSLAFVCAYHTTSLIGFVNLVRDGGYHAFILDTTVHPEHRQLGIGRGLIERAVAEAEGRGVGWVHVDYEPHLRGFYERCGFASTAAGLMRLGEGQV